MTIFGMVWQKNLQVNYYEVITFNPRSFHPGLWSIGWTGLG